MLSNVNAYPNVWRRQIAHAILPHIGGCCVDKALGKFARLGNLASFWLPSSLCSACCDLEAVNYDCVIYVDVSLEA